jgi:nitroreductase
MTEDRASVFEVIASRKSIRTYADTPIPKDRLDECLEAARLAPSWANKQCWHFVVVQGRQAVEDLGLIPAHIKGATALVVACADPDKSGNLDGKPYYMVDVAIAVEHLVLTAWDLGIGTVWVGAFKEDRVRKALGIPANIRVVALIPMGYPADKEGLGARLLRRVAGSANRKEMKEIVHWDRW